MGGDKNDAGTAIGKLMLTVLSGIAEFEADMTKEKQLEGIEELFHNRNINKMTVKQIEEK